MKKIGSGKIIAVLIVTIVLFGFLLIIQNAATKNVVTKKVIMTTHDIAEGTIITKENAKQYLKIADVETSLVPESVLTEKELWGKQLSRPISKNVMLTTNDVQLSAYKEDNYENPTKVSFSLANISNGLAGKLRSGQIVTIDTIDGATGEDVEIASNACITNVYNADGEHISNTDMDTSATIIEVIVSEKQAKKINEAESNGKIMVSRIQKGVNDNE